MWDKHYVGQDLTGFADNGQFHAVSRVTLVIDDENSVTAGDDTGIELQAECPFATQVMADAVLEQIQGYQYRAYSAEAANVDPAAELGDGVTADGLYSVIARVDDGGTGYPSLSAPGEAELQDEYPVVGPATQEMNRRIESVKKWAEENNHDLQQELEAQMEQAGKLITGQLGGHYIVTMNPENGTPNGWAEMDTDSVETAKNIWMMTMGGLGFYPNGINSTPNVALTMDGKINASMISTGILNANIIRAGRLESANGKAYIDLTTGESAVSRLIGINSDVYAEVGQTSDERGGEGIFIYKSDYLVGQLSVAPNSITDEAYPYALWLLSRGELVLQSNSSGMDDAPNRIWIQKDANGYGKFTFSLGNPNQVMHNFLVASTESVYLQRNGSAADSDLHFSDEITYLRATYGSVSVFMSLKQDKLTIVRQTSQNSYSMITLENNRIGFAVNGLALGEFNDRELNLRCNIEMNGWSIKNCANMATK